MYYFFPKLPTVFDIFLLEILLLFDGIILNFVYFVLVFGRRLYYTYFRNMLFSSEKYWGKFVFFDT